MHKPLARSLFFCLLALTVVLGACTKKKEPVVDRYSVLTSGRWQIIANWQYFPNANGTEDTVNVLAGTQACLKDNFYTFRTDNQILNDEGPSKCDPSLPQQTDKEWWSLMYEDYLYINDGGMTTHWFIDWLDEGTLVIRTDGYDPFEGRVVRHVIAYTHRQ